ncbi:MAG TPA: sigma-70 family RNA polymerase sigma factor [Terriglobales bacterium]|nr:sigma-70 family RNA polymerase sigma factor [Terriglobales bacterium]
MAVVNQVCRGDREAYWRLVLPHLPTVLSVAKAILKNSVDAEEVAQEAVLKGLCNIHGFRGDFKFTTWLIQITIDEARNRLRKARGYLDQSLNEQQTGNADEYVPKDFKDWLEIPSQALEGSELQNALQQALESLAQKYREVFTLRDIVHLNIDETAQVLGLTVANSKTRLLRARLQLRDALAPGLGGSWSNNNTDYARAGD